ncbi:MAG: hypothetical protein WB780_03820 [Candidatus Acidiferrales bacterium]
MPAEEIASLYYKLESLILPMSYGRKDSYAEVKRLSIALNGTILDT